MKLTRFTRQNGMGWSPLEQLDTLRAELNRLLESPLGTLPSLGTDFFNVWAPAVDLYEDQDSFSVRLELPGMRKDQIDVSLHEHTVTISGERKLEEPAQGQVSRAERIFGRFQRTITLPKPVEANKVKASYKDGILEVTLPKTEESKPRQIEVRVN